MCNAIVHTDVELDCITIYYEMFPMFCPFTIKGHKKILEAHLNIASKDAQKNKRTKNKTQPMTLNS